MEAPILFLSYANSFNDPLPSLEKESAIIYDLLTPAASQGRIQIHLEPFTKVDHIARYLMAFKDRVTLFHYGGHANSQQLFFRDQVANAEGIAYLLAQQKNLKLVFLNGCSTREQVELLIDLGISAVIATSVSINDLAAAAFAENFYRAIVSNHTIREAFEIAAAVVKAKTGDHPQIYRGFGWPKTDLTPLAWGLYTKDAATLNEYLIPDPIPEKKQKNVVEDSDLEIAGDAQLGDSSSGVMDDNYDHKNLIKGSTIKVGGNFTLGDRIGGK